MNLFAYSADDGIHILDGETHEQIRVFNAGHHVCCLSFSSCCGLLAVAFHANSRNVLTDGLADTLDIPCKNVAPLVLDVFTGAVVVSLESASLSHQVVSIDFNKSNDRLLCRCIDGDVLVWDLTEKAIVSAFKCSSFSGSTLVRYSRDGSLLLFNTNNKSVTESMVAVMSSSDGQIQTYLRGHGRSIQDIAVNPVFDLVATCSGDGGVIVWDAIKWTECWSRGKEYISSRLAYSCDGSKLAILASPNVTICSSTTFEELLVFPALSIMPHVTSICLNTSGTRLAVGGGLYQPVVYVLDLEAAELSTRTTNLNGIELASWEACRFSCVCYSRTRMVLL